MSDQPKPAASSKPPRRSIVDHTLRMPRWHKVLLTMALVVAAVGASGQVVAYFSPSPAAQTSGPATPRGSSLVGDSTSSEQATATPKTWVQEHSPQLTKLGGTFLVGFIVGWIFRAFIKIASILLIGALLIALGLSYFGAINLDFSTASEQYQSAVAWLTDQGRRIAEAVMAHLPNSTSGFLGMFIGFRRR
jgi:uncharacterized membrane protein (Fun14 family)